MSRILQLGLHRISNPDPNDYAVSLHCRFRHYNIIVTISESYANELKVYTPPNAATHGFSIFDDKTGKACHIKTSHVYSVRGERC